MKKLFLVDAYALIFKYYYAFLGRPMRNRAGMNTSVVFGFVKFLRDMLKREQPDLLGVALDPKGRQLPPGDISRVQGQPRRDARGHPPPSPMSNGCWKPCASRSSKSRVTRQTT